MASSVPVTMAVPPMADGLSIKEVAEQTGLAPGTIRMWEQRHGFPGPRRTASGYRRYDPDDVETLRRARAHRQRGLSVSAALERARETGGGSDHPSIYAAVAGTDHGARPQVLRKSTLIALSRAIEHEAAGPRRRAGRSSAPSSASASIARSSRATAGWRTTPTPRRCSPTSPTRAPALGRAGRGADRRGRGAGQRVGGDRRRARLRGLPAGLGAARRTSRGPRTAIAASRRSGPSIRARPGARRRRPRGWRATPTRTYGEGSRSCWPTGRWRWSSRRRR